MTRRLICFLLLLAALVTLAAIAEESLVFIYKDKQWGVADRNGKVVLPAKYGHIYPYYAPAGNERKAVYFWVTYDVNYLENSPGMLLDRNGKKICEPVYRFCNDSVMNVTAGGFISKDVVYAAREHEKGEDLGEIIYTDGVTVSTGLPFDESVFCGTNLVKIVRNGKKVLWNLDKREVERAPSRKDMFNNYLGVTEQLIYYLPPRKVAIYHAREHKDENGKCWYVDYLTGIPLTKAKYDQLRTPEWLEWWDGVFPAKINGKWGLFKLDGTVVLPPEYDWIDYRPVW